MKMVYALLDLVLCNIQKRLCAMVINSASKWPNAVQPFSHHDNNNISAGKLKQMKLLCEVRCCCFT